MDPKPPNATAQLPGRPWTCGASWPSSVFRSRIGVGSPLWHDLRIAHSVVLPRPFSACTRFSFRSSVSPTFAWFRNVPTLLIAMIFLRTATPFMRIASWSKPHAGLEFSSAMLAGLKSGTRRNGSARKTHSAHFFLAKAAEMARRSPCVWAWASARSASSLGRFPEAVDDSRLTGSVKNFFDHPPSG